MMTATAAVTAPVAVPVTAPVIVPATVPVTVPATVPVTSATLVSAVTAITAITAQKKAVTVIPATIARFTFAPINETGKRRVAGYARVSTDSD